MHSYTDPNFKWTVLGIRFDKDNFYFYRNTSGSSINYETSDKVPSAELDTVFNINKCLPKRGDRNNFVQIVIFYDPKETSINQVNQFLKKNIGRNDYEIRTLVALSNVNDTQKVQLPESVVEHLVVTSDNINKKIELLMFKKGYAIEEKIELAMDSRKFKAAFSELEELKNIKKKAENLKNRGYLEASDSADKLVDKLFIYANTYSRSKFQERDYKKFHDDCFSAINDAREELGKHRGWRRILVNAAVAVACLGIFYPVALAIQKKRTGSYLFFNKSDSAEKLDKLQKVIESDKVPRKKKIG